MTEAAAVGIWLAVGFGVWCAFFMKPTGPWISVMHLFMLPVVMILWPIFLLAMFVSWFERA